MDFFYLLAKHLYQQGARKDGFFLQAKHKLVIILQCLAVSTLVLYSVYMIVGIKNNVLFCLIVQSFVRLATTHHVIQFKMHLNSTAIKILSGCIQSLEFLENILRFGKQFSRPGKSLENGDKDSLEKKVHFV